jgi:hypothetical protein
MPGRATGRLGQILDRGDRTRQLGGVRAAGTAGVDRRQHPATSSGPAIRPAPDQGAGGEAAKRTMPRHTIGREDPNMCGSSRLSVGAFLGRSIDWSGGW